MVSTKHLFTTVVVLTVASGLSAGDWCGFRGLENHGRCDSTRGPLNWSSSQNVIWKTAIPGRGHSSPIVSGNKVYLTSTYESSHFLRTTWNYMIFVLVLLFTMTGISFAMQNIRVRQGKIEKAWQHVRFFFFAQFLVFIMVMAFFGRHLLRLDDHTTRYWLVSTVLVLSCLMLSSLFAPLKSRQQFVMSVLLFMSAIPAFTALKNREHVFSFGSLKSLVVTVTLLSPIILGLVLLVTYLEPLSK